LTRVVLRGAADAGPTTAVGTEGKERKNAMTHELEVTEQQQSRATRRAVVATGVKVAYAAPILAASFKVSASNALAISGGLCAHSSGTNGGCLPACTSAATAKNCPQPGNQCNDICGNGQTTGACPVGTGEGNPCCNPGFCDPGNYICTNTQQVQYTGPTDGCPTGVTTTASAKKTKKK